MKNDFINTAKATYDLLYIFVAVDEGMKGNTVENTAREESLATCYKPIAAMQKKEQSVYI